MNFPSNPFADKEAVALAGQKATETLSQLSLEEKIKEIAGPSNFIALQALSFIKGKGLAPTPIGGNKKKNIPAVYFTDGPRGIITGKNKTSFPVAIARAATWNTALENKIGKAMAEEAL